MPLRGLGLSSVALGKMDAAAAQMVVDVAVLALNGRRAA
jgi:hypothetical protein